jgi:1-acyl-sn-glycerol-3-phosphate acyltransferase
VSSILKLLFLGASTIIFALAVMAVALVDQDRAYRLCQLWARLNLLAFRIRVRATREVPLDASRPYVFMPNHQSHLDVLAVVAALPEFQLRWVAKRELADIPLFGWALRRGGHIVVDRRNTAQAVARLRAARAQTNAGVSVIIFPEGTRGPDENALLPFKKGGFMLALESGIPIVPIVVRGSRALLPRHSRRVHGGDIDVTVCAPVQVAGVDRDALMEQVREVMLARLAPPAETNMLPPVAEAM